MSVVRSALLAGAESAWLRRQVTRSRLARRAVSRFMPGETLEEAIAAATVLQGRGMSSLLTFLGENVSDPEEAETVTRHYLEVSDRARDAALDAEISVKVTQLGLDLSAELAQANLARIASRARDAGQRLWIDMESTPYTDRTLEAYGRLRATHANVGVAIQAYLFRTPADVERLLPLGPAFRLVKGAYREPSRLASPRKRDVDERFFALATRLLGEDARRAGAWLTVGTHDAQLIGRITAHAAAAGIGRSAFEFAMLYGIQRAEQERLAREGFRLRVLISYGTYWFPWYMRRLAERPANVLFALRSAFAG